MVKAFILGAGATCADFPNAPLDSNFFKLMNSRRPELDSKFGKIIPKYIEKGWEEVFNSLLTLGHAKERYVRSAIYKAIYTLIAEETGSNMGVEILSKQSHLYKPTLHHTLVNMCNDSDFFITLNYDLVLDMAVWENNLYLNRKATKVDYGIELSPNAREHMAKTRVSVESPDYMATTIVKEYDRIVVYTSCDKKSIYHLHGSLNWAIGPNRIIVYDHALTPFYTSAGISPLIIPPGLKEYPPLIKDIWNTAKERLQKADELIIIGCSLNPDDTELLNLITNWVEKHPDGVKKVVSKDPKTISVPQKEMMLDDYYRSFLGKDTQIYENGFDLDSIDWIFSK